MCWFQRPDKYLPRKYYENIKLICTFNYATWFDYKWASFLLHLTPKFYEFFICKVNCNCVFQASVISLTPSYFSLRKLCPRISDMLEKLRFKNIVKENIQPFSCLFYTYPMWLCYMYINNICLWRYCDVIFWSRYYLFSVTQITQMNPTSFMFTERSTKAVLHIGKWTVTETSQCTSSASKSSLTKFKPTCSYSFLPPSFAMSHSKKHHVLRTSILLHCKQLISILILMESYKTVLDDMKVGFCRSANLAEIMRVRRGLMIPEFVYLFLF